MSLELGDLGLEDLYLGEKGSKGERAQAPAGQGVGQPVQLPLDLVDEDPNQPRREFDEEALQELAQTIALRGVRQPVSVRPHPQLPGRWMLNFGARRYRASRLAGKVEIPAFVDETADTYDQVIENEQRQGLKPLELANFIGARLNLGECQAEIARRLGKSKTLISFASALIDPPVWLLQLYRQGICTGCSDLYELRRLHTLSPDRVEAWVTGRESIGRMDIRRLHAEVMAEPQRPGLEEGGPPPASPVPGAPPMERSEDRFVDLGPVAGRIEQSEHAPAPLAPPAQPAPPALDAAPAPTSSATNAAVVQLMVRRAEQPDARALWVEWRAKAWQLVVDAAPDAEGHLFVESTAGDRMVAPVQGLRLLGFLPSDHVRGD